MVRTLVEAGADVNEPDRYENSGKTPLHRAIARGLDDVVAYLIQHGALPTIPDANGQTPYQLALSFKKPELIAMLTA